MPRWSNNTVTINDFPKVPIGCITGAINDLVESGRHKSVEGQTVVRDRFGRKFVLIVWLERERGGIVMRYEVNNGEVYRGSVEIESKPCYFGGNRYYFICPKTKTRCYSLRLVKGTLVSRKCLDAIYGGGKTMPYISQTLSGLDRSRRAVKVAEYRAERRGITTKGDYWIKPKGMHYSTFCKLTEQVRKADRKQTAALYSVLQGLRKRIGEVN